MPNARLKYELGSRERESEVLPLLPGSLECSGRYRTEDGGYQFYMGRDIRRVDNSFKTTFPYLVETTLLVVTPSTSLHDVPF